jgi:hypothetical protein
VVAHPQAQAKPQEIALELQRAAQGRVPQLTLAAAAAALARTAITITLPTQVMAETENRAT